MMAVSYQLSAISHQLSAALRNQMCRVIYIQWHEHPGIIGTVNGTADC